MRFSAEFRAQLEDLFVWRRDVRRFRRDALPPDTLEGLIRLAVTAPSVGLSQPWRFVIVEDAARRAAIAGIFRDSNAEALAQYSGTRASAYARLKLAGIEGAPVQFSVFADHAGDIGHGLGRQSMPEMTDYSVVTAIHTMWLAARAAGIGLGWVSILDPARMAEALNVPAQWRLIGHFCLGYPKAESEQPELEAMAWEKRRPVEEFIVRR
jgi:5,6-dimethylbenzimidazole synthase